MRYIFCVSPGRSGTHYLYHVLSCINDVCAVHEPEHEFPEFSALKPHLWNLKDRLIKNSLDERAILKCRQIRTLLGRFPASIYAETNPLFSTLWHDAVFECLAGHDITVLILRRNTSEVIKSLLDLGWFNNRDGNEWMVTAYSVNSLVQPVCNEQDATPFDRVISYLINVEMYAQRIKHYCLQNGYRVIELHSNALFGNNKAILSMLEQCDLNTDTDRLYAMIKEKKNKSTTKNKFFDVPIEVCKGELDRYLRRCGDAGVTVPDIPYP